MCGNQHKVNWDEDCIKGVSLKNWGVYVTKKAEFLGSFPGYKENGSMGITLGTEARHKQQPSIVGKNRRWGWNYNFLGEGGLGKLVQRSNLGSRVQGGIGLNTLKGVPIPHGAVMGRKGYSGAPSNREKSQEKNGGGSWQGHECKALRGPGEVARGEWGL